MQAAEKIKPCFPLFRDDDYKGMIARKREKFEEAPAKDKVAETFEWTTSKEYQDLNFKREALTINPAKACQPLGSALCGLGFHKMGYPFRQMHSWDYSGPYHGYDGFAIFARDMDLAINNPVWELFDAPWTKEAPLAAAAE